MPISKQHKNTFTATPLLKFQLPTLTPWTKIPNKRNVTPADRYPNTQTSRGKQ